LKNIYQYSLLQYIHSQVLGEVLNLGVLLIFAEQGRVEFIYPENLQRLTLAYPTAPDRIIKGYLLGIEKKVASINNNPSFFADYQSNKADKFINDELLVADSSALQFSEVKSIPLYQKEMAQIKQDFKNRYLSLYDNANRLVAV
jgi:hypothetical protein